jgi:xanthine/uracil/vitamin C permease (AzgA family)
MFGILFYVIIKAIKKDKKALSTPTIVVALLFVAKIIVDALPAWMA